MTKITVIQCTRRKVPHFEWAIESLKKQTLSRHEYEYIIVDGLYEHRKNNVINIIDKASANFPILYLQDKFSRWNNKRPALCNARNTGIVFANGEYIVFHDDNCKLPENWLEKHLNYLEQGYIVAGNWISYQGIDNNGNGIIGAFGWEHRSEILKTPTIVGGEWLYGGNFSFPVTVAEDINGFDEFLDGEMGQDDIDFGIRAQRKGYKIMYDPSCYLEYYYTNHGLLMGYSTSRQKYVELNFPPVQIKLKDGIEHFSNEFAMQELLEDINRYTPRGNVLNLKGTREIVKSCKYTISQMYKMMEGWTNTDKYDWRDGKLIEAKLKELNQRN